MHFACGNIEGLWLIVRVQSKKSRSRGAGEEDVAVEDSSSGKECIHQKDPTRSPLICPTYCNASQSNCSVGGGNMDCFKLPLATPDHPLQFGSYDTQPNKDDYLLLLCNILQM